MLRFILVLASLCLGMAHAEAAKKTNPPKQIVLQEGTLVCDSVKEVMHITALKQISAKRGHKIHTLPGCGFLRYPVAVEVTPMTTLVLGDYVYKIVRWEGVLTDAPQPRRKKKPGIKYTTRQYGVEKTLRLISV